MDNKQYSTSTRIIVDDGYCKGQKNVMKKDLILSHESMSPEIAGITEESTFLELLLILHATHHVFDTKDTVRNLFPSVASAVAIT